MTEQIRAIAERIRALREICGLSQEECAKLIGVSEAEYAEQEQAKHDFSFSFLYNCAKVFGVDVIDLMSGDSPKLTHCTLVRGGHGFAIERQKAYKYIHLAFTFRKKLGEPFLVSVEPNDEVMPDLHAHSGQEFQYLLKGSVRFGLGEHEYVLNPGDSVYFDSSVPHACVALGGETAQFLSVVMGE